MNQTIRHQERLHAMAETFFDQPVREVTAPGGPSRASLRVHLDDGTAIGSRRGDSRLTRYEASILRTLQPFCDDLPVCYGMEGDVMFQSDAGTRRLNQEAYHLGLTSRVELAEEAVAALFRIQSAARQTDLHDTLPRLRSNPGWLQGFVNDVDILAPLMDGGVPASYPRADLPQYLDQPGIQFTKWDCRAGNAALDDEGRLRWFDFRHAGLRHGAEDFAWLIGDECWPLDGETMLDIVEDGFDPDCGHEFDDYLAYLAIYTTMHCVQRLKLILEKVQFQGWRARDGIILNDEIGRHPDFAAHLCGVGAFFAAQQPTTAMLVPGFEAARRQFTANPAG